MEFNTPFRTHLAGAQKKDLEELCLAAIDGGVQNNPGDGLYGTFPLPMIRKLEKASDIAFQLQPTHRPGPRSRLRGSEFRVVFRSFSSRFRVDTMLARNRPENDRKTT